MTGPAVAVALLAAATLMFQVLLVRVFAVEHFHHVAYMAIGVAMLGIGASGTLVATFGGASAAGARRWFPVAATATALALIATPALVHRVRLDLTQLAWSREQWLRLGAVYLLLALPFASGALGTLMGITMERARPGLIYGASFLGAGVGALLAVTLLWVAHPTRALAVPALVAALGAAVAEVGARRARGRSSNFEVLDSQPPGGRAAVRFMVAPALALALSALAVIRPPWRVAVSAYKGLPQVEAYPDARRVAERTSPLGWVVAVEAPAFRYAPGLSLTYTGAFPPQTALFLDGEIAGAVTHWRGRPDASGAGRAARSVDRGAMDIVDWLPTAIPYALGRRERVLVLGAGGGMDVWAAVGHGARRIIAVELNSALTAMSAALAPLPTRAITGAEIDWIAADARTVAARTRERFDLITLAPGGGITGAAGGVFALNEDFLHTTDAYAQYLRRLSPDGVLAVTRWTTVPARGSVRVVLTAVEALRRVQAAAVQNGIVVARSWGTATVLVKPSGFTAADVERLRAWAESRQVDLDWYPGAVAPEARFNIPEEPTLTNAARAAAVHRDSARRFAESYPFAVAPVDDARPYPHRFLRAASLRAFLQSGSASWLPFAEWGYIALIATLVQSALLAGLLVLLPVAVRRPGTVSGGGSLLPLVGYFAAIGLAYMAAEIAVIQQLTLLLGHPVYAVAGVLAVLLVCSGLGSAWSDRLAPSRARAVGVVLASLLALLAAVLLGLVHVLQPAPFGARGVAAAMLLVPVAFLMGMMFPLGIRGIARAEGPRIAWAWGANGFSSVVGAPLAALIAVEAGSRALLLVGAAAYGAAAIVSRSGRP